MGWTLLVEGGTIKIPENLFMPYAIQLWQALPILVPLNDVKQNLSFSFEFSTVLCFLSSSPFPTPDPPYCALFCFLFCLFFSLRVHLLYLSLACKIPQTGMLI